MPSKPVADLGMLVCRIVVDDDVDFLALGDLRLDVIKESDELLMPMTLHIAADDGPVEHVERGEQRGRAVAFVVVGLWARLGSCWQASKRSPVRKEIVDGKNAETDRRMGRWLANSPRRLKVRAPSGDDERRGCTVS